MRGSVQQLVGGLTRRGRFALTGVVAILIISLGLGGGAAFAYLTGSGHGSGLATVATGDQAITIATNATAGASLLPGGTGDLIITATNPNNRPVQITALSIGSVMGCTTPAVTLTTPTSGYLPVTIAASASGTRIDISGALTMGTGASNDCQGKTLTVNLSSVTVQQ